MFVKDSEAGAYTCPLSIMRDTAPSATCKGGRCMAWRPVNTSALGELGYCGMAGMPARVQQPLMGQVMLTALAGVGLAPAGADPGILIPSRGG